MARVDVTVPAYGMTESNSYIVSWLVKAGDTVESGAPLLIMETAKAETEFESPAAGVVGDILVPAEEEVAPGTVLTWIEAAS